MEEADYLIVGGGLAAASAVDGIREEDEEGSIVVLCDEAEPPYHRPPLSKEFLQNPDVPRSLLHVKPEGWFDEAGVELRLGTRALALDSDGRTVSTLEAGEFRAPRILLATGGRPRRLPAPGHHLDGVVTLRDVEDAEDLRSWARRSDRAVMVGAGFIGMELAASLQTHEVEVTVVETADRAWPRMLPPRLSKFVRGYFEDRGVSFRLGAAASEFAGEENLVERVRLEDGTELEADLVVVGIGIEPATELARDAGLEVDDGLVVDGRGETSGEGVFAAGDVARFPDPVFGDSSRVEHWDHAKAHGRLVGRNMAGASQPYDHLSYFFTDVFDLSFNVFGRPAGAEELRVRGEVDAGGFVAFGIEDGRVAGAILLDRNDAMDACREIVRRRPDASVLEGHLSPDGPALSELARELGGNESGPVG